MPVARLRGVGPERAAQLERLELRTVVDLLEFGVDFAQGYLFGAPRPAKDDV